MTRLPQLDGAPIGVPPCEAAGAALVHSPLLTVSPKLLMQVLLRVWLPLDATQVQSAARDWAPLLAV